MIIGVRCMTLVPPCAEDSKLEPLSAPKRAQELASRRCELAPAADVIGAGNSAVLPTERKKSVRCVRISEPEPICAV